MRYKVILIMILSFAIVSAILADKKHLKSQPIKNDLQVQEISEPKEEIKKETLIEPKWINYLPKRQVNMKLKTLSDIESHLNPGHGYSSSDVFIWIHEGTHGINSDIRNKFNVGPKRYNAFYCLDNKAIVILEPKSKLSSVARYVPLSLRRPLTYNLYLIQATAHWNDQPLYILDEWVAYINEAEGLKEAKNEYENPALLDFTTYSICLAMSIEKDDPNYDDSMFKNFLAWQIKHSLELSKKTSSYLEKIRTSSDCYDMKKFIEDKNLLQLNL